MTDKRRRRSSLPAPQALATTDPIALLTQIDDAKLGRLPEGGVVVTEDAMSAWLMPDAPCKAELSGADVFAKLQRYLKRVKAPVRVCSEHACFFVQLAAPDGIALTIVPR